MIRRERPSDPTHLPNIVEDEDQLADDEHHQVTIGMERLRRFSGIDRVVFRQIDRYALALRNGPLRVLVVPATEIEIPLSWARESRKVGREIALTLIDVATSESARSRLDEAIREGYSINCVDGDATQSPFPVGFDLVTSLHFMHRLDDRQAFRQLQMMSGSTNGPLIVCDYARSKINLWLAKATSRVCSRSPIVHQSCEKQIRAAFSIDEFQRLAQAALARPVKVEPVFPCHFIMACKEKTVPVPMPAFA